MWFTMPGIPFVAGPLTQECDPDTGEWWHLWDLPPGVYCGTRPLPPTVLSSYSFH
jgi:hypothetical protein